MSSANLSRRAIVNAAAALPAVAILPAAIAASPAMPDPIFTVIEKYRAAHDAFIALCQYEDGLGGDHLIPAPGETYRTPEMVAAVTGSITARNELANTSPTTLAGLIAYVDYVNANSDEEQFAFEDGEESLAFVRSLQRAVQGLAGERGASVTGLASSAAIASVSVTTDPIFAAIDAHRRAWEALAPCSELDEAASGGDQDAAQELDQLQKANRDATEKLLDVAATATPAGAAALLDYAVDHVVSNGTDCWPNGDVWCRKHGASWKTILHRNLAKALRARTVRS